MCLGIALCGEHVWWIRGRLRYGAAFDGFSFFVYSVLGGEVADIHVGDVVIG